MDTGADTPRSFTIRPAALGDLDAVVRLRQARERAENGDLFTDIGKLAAAWEALGDHLGEQSWVAVAPDGGLLACAELARVGEVFNPCLWGALEREESGPELALLDQAERRAAMIGRDEGASAIQLFAQASSRYPTAKAALATLGYAITSAYEAMQRGLDFAPPEPETVAGVEIHPFAGQYAEQVYRADEEAFLDQRGHAPRSFEQWGQRLNLGDEARDPALWRIAWDGDEVAGAALCEVISGVGWIDHLFVSRPWRKRGLGAALTRSALGALHRKGVAMARLNVDAASLTNAHLLYRREGFQVIGAYANYLKTLPLA